MEKLLGSRRALLTIALVVICILGVALLLARDTGGPLPEPAQEIRTLLKNRDVDSLINNIELVRAGPEKRDSDAWLNAAVVDADGTHSNPNAFAAGRWLEAFDLALESANLSSNKRRKLSRQLVERWDQISDVGTVYEYLGKDDLELHSLVFLLVTAETSASSVDVAVYLGRKAYAQEHGLEFD